MGWGLGCGLGWAGVEWNGVHQMGDTDKDEDEDDADEDEDDADDDDYGFL